MHEKSRVLALSGQDRSDFSCGVKALDSYLMTQATQDIRRRVSNCFVAIDPSDRIIGYYTFAAASIPLPDLPEDATRHLPRYAYAPAALIGRLAVDQRFQRQRLGETLVADALLRARESAPAIFALLVDAKDERAAAFYGRLGFRPLASRRLSFFLAIASAEKIMRGG